MRRMIEPKGRAQWGAAVLWHTATPVYRAGFQVAVAVVLRTE